MKNVRKTITIILCLSPYLFNAQIQIPRLEVTKLDSAQSRGYYILSPKKITGDSDEPPAVDLILDSTGRIVYFKKYEEGFGSGYLKLHWNNCWSFYFDEKFYVTDSAFNLIDTVFCQEGIRQDPHDFQILQSGNYLLIGYQNVEMDLTKYEYFKNGSMGLPNARVKCGVIQELSRNKKVVFQWNSKDHFKFDDVDPEYMSRLYDIDWTHFSSVECDKDGNYLIAVKNFNEITKVERATGKIIWRFGGKRNQFALIKDSVFFRGPQDVRRLPTRNITLFDCGNEKEPGHPECAREYRLDERALVATRIWSYNKHSAIRSSDGGSVQRLPNKNTLINYGRSDESQIICNVITPAGKKIFELALRDSFYNYRTINYWKLPLIFKKPEISSIQKGNEVILDAGPAHSSYYWSTGETTQTITVTKNGSYFVFVPYKNGGYLSSDPFIVDTITRSARKKP